MNETRLKKNNKNHNTACDVCDVNRNAIVIDWRNASLSRNIKPALILVFDDFLIDDNESTAYC